MKFRVSRIVVAAFATEILAVLVLVLIVALFGPGEPAAAQAYAKSLGYWVGPIAGFVFCLTGGWWVARGLTASHLANGAMLGFAAAAIDVTILVLSGASFELVFALSNIGRVVAGTLGG